MTKFLILAIIGYLCYRAVKNWMEKGNAHHQEVSSRHADQITDVMVKDPVCGVYFPKRDGVHLQVGDEEVSFCSEACKEKFLANTDDDV